MRAHQARVVAQLQVEQLQVDLALHNVALAALPALQPLQDGARGVQVVPQAAHALERGAVVFAAPPRLRPAQHGRGKQVRGRTGRVRHGRRHARACAASRAGGTR
jgi:hypothetical protein